MTEIPDWAVAVPSTPGVHPSTTALTEFTRPFTQAQMIELGAQFIEQFLKRVVLALTGSFIPGLNGAAFTQLQQYASLLPLLSGGLLSGSVIPGLDASKIVTGLFSQSQIANLTTMLGGFGTGSSILNQLIGILPGTSGGLTGLTGLGAVFTDVFGILGNPTNLGSGSPVAAIPAANVGGIQGILDMGSALQSTWNQLTNAYGGTTTPTNEVQRIVVSDFGGGTVTSGSTVLDFLGQSTAAVAYNASAATVETRLTALSTIGSGNLVASGGPLNTAPVAVTFQGALANTPLALIGHTDSLVGGTQPRANVSRVTRGGDTSTLTNLTALATEQANNASDAFGLVGSIFDILNIRNNRPVFGAVHSMSEGTHNIGQGGRVTVTATSTSAPMALQVISQDMPKTFLQVVAAKTGTITNFYLNVYKIDGSNNLQQVWNSPDLQSQLGASSAWVTADLSAAPVSALAGEAYGFEAVIVGSGSVTMLGQVNSDIPVHPTAIPKHPSAARNPTGDLTPTTITAGSIGYGGNQPFFGFGSGTPPPPYQPPVVEQKTVPGTYTYTIPAFAQVAGAKLDIITLGGGGGGQANYGTLTWYTGGNSGAWGTATTLTCGVDYPVGAATLRTTGGTGSTVVGAKGLAAGTYWTNGHAGNASSVTWTDLGGTNHTITAGGGAGGGAGGTSGLNGKSPGNVTYLGVLYPGGVAVGGNAAGSPPGGGGGGAGPYQVGGDGADGSVWITARPA